jgi:hypothetical protein
MNRRNEAGQALVVMLAFTASLLGAFFLVFNAGQTVIDKTRLVNAADASAYSAALWEARSLNFQAYTNRAIVANEVAIAQFVSLRSWSSYLGRTLENVSIATSWIPPIGRIMQLLARSWRAVDRTLQSSLPPAEAAISRWNIDALSLSQSFAHQQALIAAAKLVEDVAKLTEPRAQVSSSTRLLQVRNAAGWQNQLTSRYRRGSGELNRLRDLITASRDGFTANRRADFVPANPLVRLPKRGGTDLLGEYSWRGMDTLAVHVDLLFDDAEVPIGWGAAENRRLPVAARGTHGRSLSANPRASRLAQSTLRPRSGYLGIPEIRDVVRPQRREDLRLTYTVELQVPQSALLTADRVAVPNGIMSLDGSQTDAAPLLANSALHAMGAAELFFRRPVARIDNRREYPSLFSPYWQARLVPVAATDRLLAAHAKGLSVDPYAALP